MTRIDLIFVLATAPVFFFLLVWVVTTVYRVLVPETPPPLPPDPVTRRRQAAAEGRMVPVGASEIREDQRTQSAAFACAPYDYFYGQSEGLPAVWVEDLWRRRN